MNTIALYKYTLLLVLVFCSLHLTAQDLQVSFVDGEPRLSASGETRVLLPGDRLPVDGMLLLEEGDGIEIEREGARIFLSGPGSYLLRRIFVMSAGRQQSSLLQSLSSRILHSMERDSHRDTAVAGVRSSEAAAEEMPLFEALRMEELFLAGFELLDRGEFEQAYAQFEEAYYLASDEQLAEAGFYLGYTASLMGRLEEALELYADSPVAENDAVLHSMYVLSYSEVLLKLDRPSEAVTLINALFERDASAAGTETAGPLTEADRQLAHYYRGLALRSLGNTTGAVQDLQQAASITANPRISVIAEELLWAPQQ